MNSVRPVRPHVTTGSDAAVEMLRSVFETESISIEGSGQTVTAYRVRDDLIVRVPHQESGVDLLRREVGTVEVIGKRTSLETPEIVQVTLDAPVGRAFVAHRRVAGHILRLDDVRTMRPDRVRRIGERIGGFLGELHAVPRPDVPEVPVLTASEFADRIRTTLSEIRVLPVPAKCVEIAERQSADLRTIPDTPSVLAHTDIGGNILVDENDRVGIIDFAECLMTHPAFDAASLSVLGDDLVRAAASVYPVLDEYAPESRLIAATFTLQDALAEFRQGNGRSALAMMRQLGTA